MPCKNERVNGDGDEDGRNKRRGSWEFAKETGESFLALSLSRFGSLVLRHPSPHLWPFPTSIFIQNIKPCFKRNTVTSSSCTKYIEKFWPSSGLLMARDRAKDYFLALLAPGQWRLWLLLFPTSMSTASALWDSARHRIGIEDLYNLGVRYIII